MKLDNLKKTPYATKNAKRVGRGPGSGFGKTSGRGQKGQKARSGGKVRPTFEGGQTPLFKRLPKIGFSNKRFQTRYATINVGDLERFTDDTIITYDLLKENKILKKRLAGLKILGKGNLTKKLTVKANQFSNSAKEKIEASGGQIEVI